MFHPAHRGWLTFSAAALLSAGFLSAAPASSQAQTVGNLVNSGAPVGATTAGNNDLLTAFQQVVYLAQMSASDPNAQAALATALQNYEALLGQTQTQPPTASSWRPSQGMTGFGSGGLGGSTPDFSRFGSKVGAMTNGGDGWFSTRGGQEDQSRRHERWRRHEDRSNSSGNTSTTAPANSSTGPSDNTTDNVSASARVGKHVGDCARGNGSSSTAKASVNITDQNGQITVRAYARGGDSSASAKAVFNTSGPTSTGSTSSTQLVGSMVGHHHHSTSGTASNATNTTNTSTSTAPTTTASGTKHSGGHKTAITTGTTTASNPSTTGTTTSGKTHHTSGTTTTPRVVTSTAGSRQHSTGQTSTPTNTTTVRTSARTKTNGGTVTATATATANRKPCLSVASRQVGNQVGQHLAMSGSFAARTGGRGRR